MENMNVSEDLLNTETVNVAATGVPDEAMSKISELSKKGYQLIKENDIAGAKDAFNSILLIEDNNILYPVEIKKSAEPGKDAIKNFIVLESLNRTIGKGAVLCLSSFAIPIDANNTVLPVSSI